MFLRVPPTPRWGRGQGPGPPAVGVTSDPLDRRRCVQLTILHRWGCLPSSKSTFPTTQQVTVKTIRVARPRGLRKLVWSGTVLAPPLPPGCHLLWEDPRPSREPHGPQYSGKTTDEGTGDVLTLLFMFIIFKLLFIYLDKKAIFLKA